MFAAGMGSGGFEPNSDVLAHVVRCARLTGFEPPSNTHSGAAHELFAAPIVGSGGFEPPTSAL